MNRDGLLPVLTLLAAFLALTGCNRKTKPAAQTNDGSVANSSASATLTQVLATSPTEGYVDDHLCAECHAELYESYQKVGMANSYYLPNQKPPIEDFENNHYYHAASDRHYEMESRDGVLYQRRYQRDNSGKRFNELEVRVDAIMGSGNGVRSYLYQTEAGEIFQMPLAWYAKAKKWRLNPGYDNANHLGFQRKVNRECMFCHNAYPVNAAPGSDTYWQPDVFPKTLPHGIGCQRCHGPGQQHIELAQQNDADNLAVLASVVNPSKLSQDLEDDVCLQCHMQPSSQILSELVRFDRGEYSYRPGEPLHKYRALLDYKVSDRPKATTQNEEPEERFEINHHAYRLRQSKCYTQSGGDLSCIACHDPHKKIAPEAIVQHYRTSCLQCHNIPDCDTAAGIESAQVNDGQSQEVGGQRDAHQGAMADCAGCHMPERRTHDVIHATMTDHKIQRRPTTQSDRLSLRAEPDPVAADTEPFAYLAKDNEKSGEQAIDVYQNIAAGQLGSHDAVRRLWTYVESQGTDIALMPLAELAKALRDRNDFEGELEILYKAVQKFPNHVQVNLEMGMALAAAGEYERALSFYRQALKIGPPLPETHVGIGMSLLHRGELDEAKRQFREAVRLRPLYPEALLNLGIVLHAQENWGEAREFLLRARAADPSFVEADEYLKQIPTN